MFIPFENGCSSFTPGMCESLLEWRSPFLNIVDQQVCDLDACLNTTLHTRKNQYKHLGELDVVRKTTLAIPQGRTDSRQKSSNFFWKNHFFFVFFFFFGEKKLGSAPF